MFTELSLEKYITRNLIDVMLGLYLYTYPLSSDEHCVDSYITILRPQRFVVSEVFDVGRADELFEKYKHSTRKQSDSKKRLTLILRHSGIDTLTLYRTLSTELMCKDIIFVGLKETNAVVYRVLTLIGCQNLDVLNEIFEKLGIDYAILPFNISKRQHIGNLFKLKMSLDSSSLRTLIFRLNYLQISPYVLNYYGYQRFGTRRPITHILGKYTILNDEHLIQYYYEAHPYIDEVAFVKRLMKDLNPISMDSNSILSVLDKYKNIKTFYIEAYASFIFNTVLSFEWYRVLQRHNFNFATAVKEMKFKQLNTSIIQHYIVDILTAERCCIDNATIERVKKIFSKVVTREALAKVNGLKINIRKQGADVYDAYVEFLLPRGAYATVILRELFPCVNPLKYT